MSSRSHPKGNALADKQADDGSSLLSSPASNLLGVLFTPPPLHHPPRVSAPINPLSGSHSNAAGTKSRTKNHRTVSSERSPLLEGTSTTMPDSNDDVVIRPSSSSLSRIHDLFVPEPPRSDSSMQSSEPTPKVKIGGRKVITPPSSPPSSASKILEPLLPSIQEVPIHFDDGPTPSLKARATMIAPWSCCTQCLYPKCQCESLWSRLKESCQVLATEATKSSTWIGAFMFLLYHVVFCLTMGSTLTRQRPGGTSMIGLMTKVTAMGIMFTSPVFWWTLGDDIPALYPTVDLFVAPFFAQMGHIVDEVLRDAKPSADNDDDEVVYLSTFTFLISFSLALSGILLTLASAFKLADLASYLPSAVISGFFSAVGVLMWTLAIKVDTNGQTLDQIVSSSDWNVIGHALLHHLPSVLIASTMKYLGPKHPFWVAGLVLATIVAFHGTMLVLGLSMDDMIEREWFWSKDDLKYEGDRSDLGFNVWTPPVPLGWINSLVHGNIYWVCVVKALDTTIAFASLYLIRCSVHSAALRKNVSNLQRTIRLEAPLSYHASPLRSHKRRFSEPVDIEHVAVTQNNGQVQALERPPNTKHTMKEILYQYGIAQCLNALTGSFAVLPSVAASPTLYSLHAEKVAPQLGSVLFLTCFYMTDFQLVRFIPKPAFSALLILAFIDMIMSWFVKSYFQTKEKLEWLVVPLIVVFAFVVGLLGAVFLGISFSTFFFVASFFRSGVVKYLATGLTVRSTIERAFAASQWLDQNGELIQVIVLQNYLFFGNASSILSYVRSMFEEAKGDTDELLLPPFPKVVIMDLTLVSGVDGSAVDVVADILAVCKGKQCKLFLSGVSVMARQAMGMRGLKPEENTDRSSRTLRFFTDFDAAVGKAEDYLLEVQSIEDSARPTKSPGDSGFAHALRVIDNQHATAFCDELADLEEFTVVVDLEPGEVLYDQPNLERGLFFIEEGTMKIERASEVTLTRSGLGSSSCSLNQLKARSGTIGRHLAGVKAIKGENSSQTFRLARVGPGWILGTIEALSGLINPGITVAVDACRLHYISFKSLEEIEAKNPELTLQLYKLLSLLMAKRQEITISHLAMLHSIMGSPALQRPISRNEVRSLRRNLLGQTL